MSKMTSKEAADQVECTALANAADTANEHGWKTHGLAWSEVYITTAEMEIDSMPLTAKQKAAVRRLLDLDNLSAALKAVKR